MPATTFASSPSSILTMPAAVRSLPSPLSDDLTQAIPLAFPDSHSASTYPAVEIGRGQTGPVWYRFVGTGDMVEVTTSGSSFDTFLTVFADYGRGPELVDCHGTTPGGRSRVEFYAIAETPYFFRVQGFAGPGGQLTIATLKPVPFPPAPFGFRFEIDPVCAVNPRTGLVTIRGSIESAAAGKFSVDVTLGQEINGNWIHAYGVANFQCDRPGDMPWSIRLRAWDGFFVTGPAFVSGYAEGCGSGLRDYWSELIEPFAIALSPG